MESLKQNIGDWNGKSIETITLIYQQHAKLSGFIEAILDLLKHEEFQIGSSWLLKHHFEKGSHLNENEIGRVYQCLEKLEGWEAKLHILQSIPYMPIPSAKKECTLSFIRKCLEDDNKFLRAWAYNGFYEVSLCFPEYQKEVKTLLEAASESEAASVKARIRNIMKAGF